MELTKRQEYILSLIIREYVNVPTPIGSKVLVERYNLDVSSATVRNDMAALEEAGLIESPHTSAGRVPTEAGYRYFVHRLLGDTDLSPLEERMIRHQFHQANLELEQWMRLAASVLANTTRTASIVTSPRVAEANYKHVELIHTQGRMVLLVVVLEGGDVRQQMLSLTEPVTQEMLSAVAARLNAQCLGLNAGQIRNLAGRAPTLDHEVMHLVAQMLDRAGRAHRVVVTDGLLNILDPQLLASNLAPGDERRRDELSRALVEVDSLGARQALRLLEEQSRLEEVLSEALSADAYGVQVLIAGEGRWDELSHTTMVFSRYGHGFATGTLGVLGPTRLHYGRAISAVRYVAGLMTDLLIEIYGDEELLE